MAHANAALTPRHRLMLAKAIVEDGWTVSYAAAVFNVSWPTANRWAQRYRTAGEAGMADRSSRPHRCPRRTPAPLVRKIVHLRWKKRLGPVAIADRLGLAPSTVHAVLTRHGLHRLAWLDRPTGEPVRRYERARPGELVHVDVKKLGRLRDGGGWRFLGRDSLEHRRARDAARVGYEYVHCAIDDHTRLAYAEIHPDERGETCAGFLRRAAAAFAAQGISAIERVMTDNALAYRRSTAWQQALTDLGAQARFTRRYRPQTNGKAERFNRTLLEEWAYARPFSSGAERAAALPGWLHTYNNHRTHTALGGHPPISRVNNVSGHYS